MRLSATARSCSARRAVFRKTGFDHAHRENVFIAIADSDVTRHLAVLHHLAPTAFRVMPGKDDNKLIATHAPRAVILAASATQGLAPGRNGGQKIDAISKASGRARVFKAPPGAPSRPARMLVESLVTPSEVALAICSSYTHRLCNTRPTADRSSYRIRPLLFRAPHMQGKRV